MCSPPRPMDPVERIKCMTMGKSDLHVCVMTHITLDLELFPFRRSVSNLIILHPVHLDKTLFAGTCILCILTETRSYPPPCLFRKTYHTTCKILFRCVHRFGLCHSQKINDIAGVHSLFAILLCSQTSGQAV